jgi:hypothetical protein
MIIIMIIMIIIIIMIINSLIKRFAVTKLNYTYRRFTVDFI